MKLGIFDHMQKNDKPERSYADMYANHLEVVEFVDQAGMDFYFVAEHHFDLGFSECPSPGAFLGAASQRTKRIRLGPLVYVLPLWNPIRVAEEVAVLDNLTQGRLECGFGAGVGPFTFAAYGVPWDEKRKMAWEALRMIKGIWANPSYSYEGEYFKCKNVELGIPLVQQPHPPLWMPTRSRESLEEAASLNMSTVQWVPPRMKVIRAAFDHYREVYQHARPAGRKPHIGLMREIYVAANDKRPAMKSKITGSIFGSDAVAAEPTAVTGMRISRRCSMASVRKNFSISTIQLQMARLSADRLRLLPGRSKRSLCRPVLIRSWVNFPLAR